MISQVSLIELVEMWSLEDHQYRIKSAEYNLALRTRVEWLARDPKGEKEIWVVHTIYLIDVFSSDIVLEFFKELLKKYKIIKMILQT